MYSSLDNPTHQEWVNESNRLLGELEDHLIYYTKKIREYQNDQNDFMVKFYCVKLLEANRKLELLQLTLS